MKKVMTSQEWLVFSIELSYSMKYNESSNIWEEELMENKITHEKYGVGIIKSVEKAEMGYNVTVEFESVGEKVMLCAFNPLEEKV